MPREVEGPPLRTPPNERSPFVRWCGAPRATPFNASPGRQRGNRGTREASTFNVTSGGARGLTPHSRTQFRLIWGEGCFELLILKHRFGWKFPQNVLRVGKQGMAPRAITKGSEQTSLRSALIVKPNNLLRLGTQNTKNALYGDESASKKAMFSGNKIAYVIRSKTPLRQSAQPTLPFSEWSPPASEKVGIVLIWVGPDRELGGERFPSHMVNSVLSES